MIETASNPESEKNKIPIRIILGRHNDSAIGSLTHLDHAIGESLRDTNRNVIVFYEDNLATQAKAQTIERLTESGYPLLTSYSIGQYIQEYGSPPDLGKNNDHNRIHEILAGISPFARKEMEIINDHMLQNKRIRLIWEFQENDTEKRIYKSIEGPEAMMDVAFKHVMNGTFRQGLGYFKSSVLFYAEDDRSREDRLKQRITSAAWNKDTGAIVGYIGDIHTRIQRLLASEGFKAKRKLPDSKPLTENPKGLMPVYTWSPTELAIRYHILYPQGELTDLDWYKLMIGGTIHENLIDQREREQKITGRVINNQDIVVASLSKMNKITNSKSIKDFETLVRKNGFTAAAMML